MDEVESPPFQQSLYFEAVTTAAHGGEILGIVGPRLDLFAQAPYMDVHGARRHIVLLSPHFVQQLLPAVGAPGMRDKEFEQPELRCSQRDLLVAEIETSPRAVQLERTLLDQ